MIVRQILYITRFRTCSMFFPRASCQAPKASPDAQDRPLLLPPGRILQLSHEGCLPCPAVTALSLFLWKTDPRDGLPSIYGKGPRFGGCGGFGSDKSTVSRTIIVQFFAGAMTSCGHQNHYLMTFANYKYCIAHSLVVSCLDSWSAAFKLRVKRSM